MLVCLPTHKNKSSAVAAEPDKVREVVNSNLIGPFFF